MNERQREREKGRGRENKRMRRMEEGRIIAKSGCFSNALADHSSAIDL